MEIEKNEYDHAINFQIVESVDVVLVIVGRSNLGGLYLLSISRVTSSKVRLGNVTLSVFFYPTTSQLDSSVIGRIN